MRHLLKSSFAVVVGTLLYKVGFLVKDIVLTSKMGIGSELTLFVTAFLIPSFLSNTIAQSLQVSSTAWIMKSDQGISISTLTGVFWKVLALAIGGFAVLTLAVPYIFTSFNADEISILRLAIWFSCLFFITMPVRGILGQVLYIRRYFILNFSLALICPIGMIAYIYLSSEPKALPLMQVLGVASVVELFIVATAVAWVGGIKKEHGHESLSYRNLLSGFVFQLLLMSPPLIDQLLAHWQDAHFLTAFSYAIKIPNILTTISMIVASSVFLPYFMAKSTVSIRAPKLILLIPGLIIWALSPWLSPFIVQLIFQRGAFTAGDTAQIASLQSLYFLSAPLTAVFMVYIRYLNAQEKNRQATTYLAWLAGMCFGFGLVWNAIDRHDLIPLSILLSYGILFGYYWFNRKEKV